MDLGGAKAIYQQRLIHRQRNTDSCSTDILDMLILTGTTGWLARKSSLVTQFM